MAWLHYYQKAHVSEPESTRPWRSGTAVPDSRTRGSNKKSNTETLLLMNVVHWPDSARPGGDCCQPVRTCSLALARTKSNDVQRACEMRAGRKAAYFQKTPLAPSPYNIDMLRGGGVQRHCSVATVFALQMRALDHSSVALQNVVI